MAEFIFELKAAYPAVPPSVPASVGTFYGIIEARNCVHALDVATERLKPYGVKQEMITAIDVEESSEKVVAKGVKSV